MNHIANKHILSVDHFNFCMHDSVKNAKQETVADYEISIAKNDEMHSKFKCIYNYGQTLIT